MSSAHRLLARSPAAGCCCQVAGARRQPRQRSAVSVRAEDGRQGKGFGAPAARPTPAAPKAPSTAPTQPPPASPSTTPSTSAKSKASMDQYRSVLAAEQAAKAQQAPAASTSGRPARTEPEPVAATPAVVSDRMLQRIILFSGVPVFVGFLLYPLFYYLKVVQGVDVPMAMVYIVQVLTFGGGLAGITYAVLSTSWDPTQPGSLLGWTEFQGNLPLLLDRFKRRD